MSRLSPQTPNAPGGFPRVSGDEPDLQRYLGLVAEFSPRERGMSRHPPQRRQGRPRFPRVSGDEPPTAPANDRECQFSPRERG